MNHRAIRRVAVIGSGLAGLTAALRLRESGLDCALYEKGSGPGGRLSSKRLGDGSVDLGAQFFTVRSAGFSKFLEDYAEGGCYAIWAGRFSFETDEGELSPFHNADRFVGTPRMSALTRSLAHALEDSSLQGRVSVHYRQRIVQAVYEKGCWHLHAEGGQCQGPFDALIVTTPPAQAADLMGAFPEVREALSGYIMEPCWAVVCGFETPLPLAFDAIRSVDPVLGWAARDSSKPLRWAGRERWVLHAQPGWSSENQDKPVPEVVEALTTAFADRFGLRSLPSETLAHRWLYAKPVNSKGPGHLAFDEMALGFCGDWLSGGRVEGAFASADSLLAHWRTTLF